MLVFPVRKTSIFCFWYSLSLAKFFFSTGTTSWMLPAMINRVFVLMLLGLGLAKLPAAELEIWKLLDIWPDKVPGEKGDVPSETLTTHKHRGAPILKYNNVTKPTLTVFKPTQEMDTGASVGGIKYWRGIWREQKWRSGLTRSASPAWCSSIECPVAKVSKNTTPLYRMFRGR